jgi:hypothetical protein
MKDSTKKVIAISLIGALGLGLSGVAGAVMFPRTIEVPVEKVVTQIVKEPVEVIKTVEVPVNVTVTKEVPVDNGNLALVLDHIYDNDGEVAYLTEDLKDSEVSDIVDRIVFINDAKALAVAEVKENGVDEVDKEVAGSITVDEDDVDKFKVYDEDDKLEVSDVDFDDKDCEVLVKAKLTQDDDVMDVVYKVTIQDGEVEDLEVESVEVRA